MRLPVLSCTLLLTALPVFAAPVASDKDSGLYDVEVLVFENRLPDLIGDELLTREVSSSLQRRLDSAVPPETTPDKSYLKPVIADLLQGDGSYRILAHGLWRQAPADGNVKPAKPVRIASAVPSELEGAVRLVLNRYLHLEVNMLYRDLSAAGSAPQSFQISDSRRIKSQETQYFDHPRFGVLVRVMPVTKEELSPQ